MFVFQCGFFAESKNSSSPVLSNAFQTQVPTRKAGKLMIQIKNNVVNMLHEKVSTLTSVA
jgi:hypothetical protein